MNPQIWAAVIGGCVALIGLVGTNIFATRRETRAKELAFKIECYQRFVNAFFAMAEHRTHDTQLELTKSVNLMALMASRGVLEVIRELRDNHSDTGGTEKRAWDLLNTIVYEMRRDMLGSTRAIKKHYEFPFFVPDIQERSRHRATDKKD